MVVFHTATEKKEKPLLSKWSYECLVEDMEIELTGRRASSGPKCCPLAK